MQSQRDLGVIVSRDLSPTNHINAIVVKAHRRANLILRAFESRDVCLLLRAFLVYVEPLLEYNSVLWSPCTIKDIQAIENVQRRFTKPLHGLKSFTYQERLRADLFMSRLTSRLPNLGYLCREVKSRVNLCRVDS